jgi:hypothetical protein
MHIGDCVGEASGSGEAACWGKRHGLRGDVIQGHSPVGRVSDGQKRQREAGGIAVASQQLRSLDSQCGILSCDETAFVSCHRVGCVENNVDPVIASQIGVSGKDAGAAVAVNAIAAGNIASGRGC